ncbi:teicoplanin resistance protein VanZ [Ornithinibacillus halotolerans]|uniref:Teicoplanin resistance protein VanZ n=1 Tax=Ornithinibacillus halotolerans TaxID=1274357 RepID=A0A916W601_9BACI|nr:teicoplanin resistance protein VanZ [Ornithinibacillus halotolerans]GGA69513.1 hypothetical protein GCM10008025_11840 [Ornithinibacillus halotolerans]
MEEIKIEFDFTLYKENENIRPLKLNIKEETYRDLANLELSMTGRVDALISNTFIQEAVQLVINAISLFEKGYFDSAYYSLRQSLEVSTTIVYLMELDSTDREIELLNWKKQSRFPMYSEMVKFLIKNEKEFANIKKQMSNYFNKLQLVKERLNKYVHKQGFNTFYVSRNHFANKSRDDNQFIKEFEGFVEACIGAIAVFRLSIDPIPVLLLEEEIYERLTGSLTEPFTEDFISKYIGEDEIRSYKKTNIYLGYYEGCLTIEKRLPSVIDLLNYQFIDKSKIDEILSQVHLLSDVDIYAVTISNFSDKVATIYCDEGLTFYFTTTKSNRLKNSFNSMILKQVKESNSHKNFPYDEAFLTYYKVDEIDIFIEHNEEFEESEVSLLTQLLKNSRKNNV